MKHWSVKKSPIYPTATSSVLKILGGVYFRYNKITLILCPILLLLALSQHYNVLFLSQDYDKYLLLNEKFIFSFPTNFILSIFKAYRV